MRHLRFIHAIAVDEAPGGLTPSCMCGWVSPIVVQDHGRAQTIGMRLHTDRIALCDQYVLTDGAA